MLTEVHAEDTDNVFPSNPRCPSARYQRWFGLLISLVLKVLTGYQMGPSINSQGLGVMKYT